MRQRRAVTEGGQAAAYAVGGEVLHVTVVVVQAGELPSLGHHEVADRTQPGIHAPRRYDTGPGCGREVTAGGVTAGAHRGSRTGRRCAGKPPPRTWPRPRPRTRSSRRGRESARCAWPRGGGPVSYTHLRAHETRHDLVCRLLLEKKKK